jgi:transposase-like protein
MRIRVELPKVEPEVYEEPETCPYEGCEGRYFKAHGVKEEAKALRDLDYEEVHSYRQKCMKCKRTFRVYPRGVSKGAQQSKRLKAISVLLYVLGLSYGGVADVLAALDVAVGKTTVYDNVQAAGVQARRRQRGERTRGGPRAVIGTDGTYMKVKGEEIGLQVIVDDQRGDLVGLDIIVSERADEVLDLLREVAEEVEAEVLVSDDLDSYKVVADELGLAHQICRSHVKRNVDDLADSLRAQLQTRQEAVPPGVASSPQQLETDLERLQSLVRERPPDGAAQLKQCYHRYQAAPKPPKGQRHTVWYRMRMLVTRLWERWERLTLDLRRDDLDLDGTNNSAERVIGWWAKERYRTMRGYKRTLSILNVVTLTARMGVRSGSYDLSELFA